MTYPPERTRDIYEHVPGYPIPPSVPLPDVDDPSTLEDMGVKPGRFSATLVRLATRLTGFRSFQQQLPGRIDELLRTENLRGPGLFAPVIAATLVMQDDPRPVDPVQRAATLLFGARQLHDEVMSARLEPDTLKGQVLEMGQYPNLFSTSLIVDGKTPRIFKSSKLTQITVLVGGRIHLLEMGDLMTETSFDQLAQALHQIVAQAQNHPLGADEFPAGALTSGTAKTQVAAFSQMEQSADNRESLEAMRHSFLTLCLDLESQPTDDGETGWLAHTGNPDNRWHNSSLQLVVFGNARAVAICNFNAYVDGNTMMRGVAEIQRRATQVSVPEPPYAPPVVLPPARALSWSIPQAAVQQARKDLDWVRGEKDATFVIPDIGRTFFTEHGLGAVPTFIVALQMTAGTLIDRPVGITQFLSMTRFCCMGVKTEVVTTPEVERFVALAKQDGVDPHEAMALLRRANDSQAQAARHKRRQLPLREVFSIFVTTKRGASRLWTIGVLAVTVVLLRLFGKFQFDAPDIITSHPAIYPEVPVVGRPGIRLPYAREFGLHYQIWEDHITIVMMPALQMKHSNQEIISTLSDSLARIRELALQASVNHDHSDHSQEEL